jgi:hypothetical protein
MSHGSGLHGTGQTKDTGHECVSDWSWRMVTLVGVQEFIPVDTRLLYMVPSFMSQFSELLMRVYRSAEESCDLFMGSVSTDGMFVSCVVLEGESGHEGQCGCGAKCDCPCSLAGISGLW